MDTDDAEPTSASAAAAAVAAAAAAAVAAAAADSRNAIAAADTAAADGGGEADDESGSSDDDAASDDDGPDVDAAHAEFEFESDGEDGRPKRIIPGVIRDGDDSSEWSSSSESETEQLDLNNMPKWLEAGPSTRPRSPSTYAAAAASLKPPPPPPQAQPEGRSAA